MHLNLDTTGDQLLSADLKVLTAFQKITKGKTKTSKEETSVSIDHWEDKSLVEEFNLLKSKKSFKAAKDEMITFSGPLGETVWVVGLGDKTKYTSEDLRKSTAKIWKNAKAAKFERAAFDIAGFNAHRDEVETMRLMAESLWLTDYSFEKYKSKKSEAPEAHAIFSNFDKKHKPKIDKVLSSAKNICESISTIKDFVNEAPNFLHSEEYAKRIEADVKKNLKGVKVKILDKAQIQKEKMGLFLSVNAGSAYEPRLVHLTYTPTKATSKTKHIALVGKGITFDTGGYSLKPGASMAGMKNDMGGSATVYGAFRAAVLEKAPVKITCILALTDNAVSSTATFPDAVITGRNGKTVEILNTDAEVLGNDQKWIEEILGSAKAQDEYMWQLPIIQEWRQDIKSKIADLKNIGTPMRAGTAIGAAFLEEFVKNDIKWAHLDVAGVVDAQSHLPYCSAHGASGLIVRTLTHLLLNAK